MQRYTIKLVLIIILRYSSMIFHEDRDKALSVLDYIFSESSLGGGTFELYKSLYWIVRMHRYSENPVNRLSLSSIRYTINRTEMLIYLGSVVVCSLPLYWFKDWYSISKNKLSLREQHTYINNLFALLKTGNKDSNKRYKILTENNIGHTEIDRMEMEATLQLCSMVVDGLTNDIPVIQLGSFISSTNKYTLKVCEEWYVLYLCSGVSLSISSISYSVCQELISIKVYDNKGHYDFIIFLRGTLVYYSDKYVHIEKCKSIKRIMVLGEMIKSSYMKGGSLRSV